MKFRIVLYSRHMYTLCNIAQLPHVSYKPVDWIAKPALHQNPEISDVIQLRAPTVRSVKRSLTGKLSDLAPVRTQPIA